MYEPEAITPVIAPLYRDLWQQITGAGICSAGPAIAYYEDAPTGGGAIVVHAAVQLAPEIVTRAEQPYVAITARLTMAELGGLGPRLSEVFAWLGARGLAPAGPPFFKYDVIDMAGKLVVEAGVPVAVAVDGDAEISSGVLPAGRYATLTHVGHPGWSST